jgi:hypothetical protein
MALESIIVTSKLCGQNQSGSLNQILGNISEDAICASSRDRSRYIIGWLISGVHK